MELDISRLIRCREKLGISKQEAARRIGISQPAYLRYEAGERQPSAQMIKEIAKALNTSVEYLTGTSKSPAPVLIEVNKQNNKALFQIVEQCSDMDAGQQEHLLAYIKAIKKGSSPDNPQ